jgi:hypothetical protein
VSEDREYLQPTRLCDFDRDGRIAESVLEATGVCSGLRERFDRVQQFVRGMPYGLEDWDVRASETLRRGWGMCSGKANLLVAMSRVLLIPARYRVFRIRSERRLLQQVIEQNRELGGRLGGVPDEQDHVQCEVYLDGWQICDPSRDPDFENGLRRLGVPLERVPVAGADGAVRVLILSSIDDWAEERQRRRLFREDRRSLFVLVNQQIDRIRELGRKPHPACGGV